MRRMLIPGLCFIAFMCACQSACGAETKQVAKEIAVETERCAIPVLARLLACYAQHDKSCVIQAGLELTACMATPHPPAPLPAIDSKQVLFTPTAFVTPESPAPYSLPRSTWYPLDVTGTDAPRRCVATRMLH